MKKFILKALLFTIPFLLVTFLIEHKLRGIKNSYTTKKTNLEKNAASVNTLVMGASHSLFGINPEYFTKSTFNLAHSSQSLYFDKEIILKELTKLPNLKNVILPISYFSLYYNMKDGKEKQRVYAYYQFWGIKSQDFRYTDFDNYSLISLLTPQTVFYIALTGFKTVDQEGNTNNLNKYGFMAMDSVNLNTRINDSLGYERYLFHTSMIKKENAAMNKEILGDLISILNKKNINVYIVTTPTYKTYNQYLKESILSENKKIVGELCSNHKATYFDYSTDTRFSKEDFYDNDHLNKYGAVKFSKILDSIILSKQ